MDDAPRAKPVAAGVEGPGGAAHSRTEFHKKRRHRRRKRLAATTLVAAALGGAAVPGHWASEQANASQGAAAPVTQAESIAESDGKLQPQPTDPGVLPVAAGAVIEATIDVGDNLAALSLGQELACLPWGDDPGSVGLRTPQEGLAAGPQALAVAPDGRIAVLDTINTRVICLSAQGAPVADMPLPLREPRFIAVNDERLLVLDADADRRLVELDWEGNILAEHAVPETQDPISGIFADAAGILIETGHRDMFALTPARGRGRAAEMAPARAQGRPLPAATLGAKEAAADPHTRQASAGGLQNAEERVSAAYGKGGRPRLTVLGDSGSVSAALTIYTRGDVDHLVALSGDDEGHVILGCRMLRDASAGPGMSPSLSPADPTVADPSGRAEQEGALLLVRLLASAIHGERSTGAVSSLTLAEYGFADIGEPFAIAPSGLVYQPVAAPDGYHIMVHRFPDTSEEAEEATR